jgi:CIC family chloride channel protein
MLAGAAGGIGAIFRAPLGGALFVVEVLYASTAIEFSAIVPAVISSVVAYSVFVSIFGAGSALTVVNLKFHGFSELPGYLAFAVLCALVGFLYVSVFYGMRDHIFRKIKLPNFLKPAIGGLAVGLIALELPQIMAGGYGWIQRAIDNDGSLTVQMMLVLALAKIVATSFTISSGGSGGVFAPSLFIGAMLGGAYGYFLHQLHPDAVVQPEAYVLVGMGGFFAGVAKVPLTALIMVSEMCGSYALLVPLMLVSVISVAVLSSRWTLYEEQVGSLVDSPAHLGDFVIDVLARIQVRSVYRVDHPIDLVPENMPLPEILRLVSLSRNNYFPVVDSKQQLVGIFSLRDIRATLEGDRAGALIVAADIATFPVLTVTPDDDLHDALRRFTRKNIDELPIVDPANPRRVIGMLRRKEVIGAYDEQLAAMRHDA